MTRILVDSRWVGPHGIGRFAREVLKRLPAHETFASRPRPLGLLDTLATARAIRRVRPDVYFSPGFNAPASSAVPFVFTIHDLIHLRVAGESGPLRRAYYRLVVRPGARRAFRVLTVSQHSKKDILAWSGLPAERVVVVGNGVGAEFSPDGPAHRPGYPYLLHVGGHKPHKNLLRLFEAFAASGLSHELRLVLTGRADRAAGRLVRRVHLEGRVIFVGELSDKDLPAWYRGAAALVIPSLYEGFGLPAIEAMACGTVVLASNVTALPEVAGDAALMVDPCSVDAIAEGIRSVVLREELRKTLVAEGLRRCKAFSWDQTAEKVRQVLEQAAG